MDKKMALDMVFEADAQDRKQWAEESAPWTCPKCKRQHPWHHKECWWCKPTGFKKPDECFLHGKGVVMEFLHVTLEPAEENDDGSAVTLYTMVDSVEDVKAAVKAANGNFGLPLSVAVNDEFFEVLRTRLQPFMSQGIFRFQAHLTC